ncbi:sensor histidine kinase [Sorangium sp. So ce363]|uniref:sensor histidine kinase n=1 Tax=Sorangium sp. So ce363 TaxID=3133304 RepID=UPI003F5DC27B
MRGVDAAQAQQRSFEERTMSPRALQLNGELFQLADVDLVPLVASTAESAQSIAATPKVHVALPPDTAEPLVVKGDAARLEQVLMNLLVNAFKHANGTPQVEVRLRRAGGGAELDVEDYGPGIPAASLPHVFSSFYQVESAGHSSGGGMGLGLFICREIVRAHGGQIFVRSTEGKGATFTVRLPLIENR